jgi:hypothetical protein
MHGVSVNIIIIIKFLTLYFYLFMQTISQRKNILMNAGNMLPTEINFDIKFYSSFGQFIIQI